MNLQYFYNYVTIVEEGSLTAASKKLHVAQPALSNQIKAMEQKYGTRLFFRGARRLELTDAGMILYRKAKSICEIEQAAQNEILSGFSGQQGMLRVGVTPSVAHGRITDVLLDFAQKYPQIEIKYLEAGPMDLCKMLHNGIIEMAALKTMGDLPENVHVIATDVAPTVALYDPKAGLLNEVIGDTVTIEQLSNVPLAMEEQYLIPYLMSGVAFSAIYYAMFSQPHLGGLIPSLTGTFMLILLVSIVKHFPFASRSGSSLNSSSRMACRPRWTSPYSCGIQVTRTCLDARNALFSRSSTAPP